jgi:hypothetical protein
VSGKCRDLWYRVLSALYRLQQPLTRFNSWPRTRGIATTPSTILTVVVTTSTSERPRRFPSLRFLDRKSVLLPLARYVLFPCAVWSRSRRSKESGRYFSAFTCYASRPLTSKYLYASASRRRFDETLRQLSGIYRTSQQSKSLRRIRFLVNMLGLWIL